MGRGQDEGEGEGEGDGEEGVEDGLRFDDCTRSAAFSWVYAFDAAPAGIPLSLIATCCFVSSSVVLSCRSLATHKQNQSCDRNFVALYYAMLRYVQSPTHLSTRHRGSGVRWSPRWHLRRHKVRFGERF